MRGQLEEILDPSSEHALACHTMEGYPNGLELARALRMFMPHFVLLSFEHPETAVAVMRYLEAEASGLPVIALHAAGEALRTQATMRESMRAGAREFLTPPFSIPRMAQVLEVVRGSLKQAPLSFTATNHIYSFLPAKPGAGATTVALNASAAFARVPGMRVLLTDLDLACGMIRFLWELPDELSIVDALTRAGEMDAFMWPQLVTERDGVDIMHSGGVNPQAYLDAEQIQSLINFARTNYNALFFDMSGNFERHSIHVMQESKRVFLVCNPEPGSLSLARERLVFLRSLGLDGRVAAIMNRADQRLAIPAAKVEAFLGIPVAAQISNDYREIRRAIRSGRSLFASVKVKESRLTQDYSAFARSLFQGGQGSSPEPASLGVPGHVAVLA
jgi:pilus assembly protein CpaE